MSQTFSHGYALIIGVGTCDFANWSLPVTKQDAQALLDVLTDASLCAYLNDEGHIRFLHDASASRKTILDGLCWLKAQVEADGAATAFVYFSGHGWLDKRTGKYYLIPSDVQPFDILGTAVSAIEFTDTLHQISAKRLLVIIDSCHAEGMASVKDEPTVNLPPNFSQTAPPGKVIADLKQGEGRVVFTSSRGTQRSWIRRDKAMSIYTYHLIEALKGANNKPGETMVYLSNLMNHLSKTVPQSAQMDWQAEQVPFFDMATEDYPIAVLQGGKSLPVGGWEALEDEARTWLSIGIQGDGNIVGKRNISQVVKATGGSTISGVTQIAYKEEE